MTVYGDEATVPKNVAVIVKRLPLKAHQPMPGFLQDLLNQQQALANADAARAPGQGLATYAPRPAVGSTCSEHRKLCELRRGCVVFFWLCKQRYWFSSARSSTNCTFKPCCFINGVVSFLCFAFWFARRWRSHGSLTFGCIFLSRCNVWQSLQSAPLVYANSGKPGAAVVGGGTGRLDEDEDATLLQLATEGWDGAPQASARQRPNFIRRRQPGGAGSRALHPNYVCNRCGVPGHHIRDCPTIGDSTYQPKRRKEYVGMPKEYLATDEDGTVTGLISDEQGFAKVHSVCQVAVCACTQLWELSQLRLFCFFWCWFGVHAASIATIRHLRAPLAQPTPFARL